MNRPQVGASIGTRCEGAGFSDAASRPEKDVEARPHHRAIGMGTSRALRWSTLWIPTTEYDTHHAVGDAPPACRHLVRTRCTTTRMRPCVCSALPITAGHVHSISSRTVRARVHGFRVSGGGICVHRTRVQVACVRACVIETKTRRQRPGASHRAFFSCCRSFTKAHSFPGCYRFHG